MFPVIFVSLGPGEPELITVKGLKALQTADCIFCPETLAKDGNRVSRAADILLQLDIPENTVYRFPLPMSKQREKALSAYDEVYMESSTLRQQGKKVCIVAEGDAGFYSSIHYVYDKLQADGIPVKHIPGIPAFIAAGALGGLHVASQEERLTVIPGITTTEEIEKLTSENSAVVIMKFRLIELAYSFSLYLYSGTLCIKLMSRLFATKDNPFNLIIPEFQPTNPYRNNGWLHRIKLTRF